MTLLKPTRRGFLFGALAAPAIVHAANLMPIWSAKRSWLELRGLIIIRNFGHSVILPPSVVGEEITIINHDIVPLTIYGAAREVIAPPQSIVPFCDFGCGWQESLNAA